MEEYTCICCSKHVPLPQSFLSIEVKGTKVWLCPTSYFNLKRFLVEWKEHGGLPPGSIRKHYSDYVLGLAKDIVGE